MRGDGEEGQGQDHDQSEEQDRERAGAGIDEAAGYGKAMSAPAARAIGASPT